MGEIDISELIRDDREKRKSTGFEGTFLDYLEILKENPQISMLSHQRMYEIVTSKGMEVINTEENPRLRRIYGNENIKRYNFFANDFFGIDNTIMKIVRYFHSAAMAGRKPDRSYIL